MADTPLLELEESWVFGMLWPKRLLIFEDRIETHGSELLRETIETIQYGEIEDVIVGGGGWSASLLIKHGNKPLLLRGVDEAAAGHAKSLIGERMARPADSLHQASSDTPTNTDLIRKLAELRDAGVLTPEEFEAKRKAVEEGHR